MSDILETIVAHKRKEVELFKQELPQSSLESRVEIILSARATSMAESLRNSDIGIIAEFKRKSPSKGWFNKDADVRTITWAYQENGATALSILTDVNFFGGNNNRGGRGGFGPGEGGRGGGRGGFGGRAGGGGRGGFGGGGGGRF